MLFAGALAVGMSVPASAFVPVGDALIAFADPAGADNGPLQTVEASDSVEAVSAAREQYGVVSWAEMLVLKYGTRDYKYQATGGSIRWPFPMAVTISSGFGERAAPCNGCSSMHMGLDFQPPNDSPVYAIADGTVIQSQDDAYGYGNHVIIDHGDMLGDGHDVQSLYAHMQHYSVALVAGQQIHVGDFIGLVGRTGTATGIHLHLEILVDHVQIDPFAWLQNNTN
jgi:murein DD-endopeptidase MepM/ murein hydrolase activator NlpD